MRTDLRGLRAPSRRTTTSIAAAVTLIFVAPPASAAPAGDATLTVDGTLVQLVVDRSEALAGGVLEIQTAVQVDGTLIALPPSLPEVSGQTGDEVILVLAADSGLSLDEALEEAAEPTVGDAAWVVDVMAAPAAAAMIDESLARGVTGARSLTILPVFWSARDGATVASLTSLADTTARYWSDQSAGGIAFRTEVRDWAQIPDPGSCSTSALWSSALAAHGVAAPGIDEHVVVYFPQRADCGGWAGYASLGGGSVWINGAQNRDVVAHEVGHNLGLGHANLATCGQDGARASLVLPLTGTCALSEYGDRADVMGIGLNAATGNLNTALADALGLVVVHRPSAGTTTSVDLSPLAAVGRLRSVAIPVQNGTVYVDYRPATGPDTRMPAWAGVQVHLRTVDPNYGYPTSFLLDMSPRTSVPFATPSLAVGASWAVPGTTQVVTVTGTGATARVQVAPADRSRDLCPDPGSAGPLPVDSPALFRAGVFLLRGSYTNGGADVCFGFGDPSDIPVMGDWDGDGTRTPGVFRAGTWYLRNANGPGAPDFVLQYGSAGDVPVVGDWNNDDVDTVGVFRQGVWHLRNANTSGAADGSFGYGRAGDLPVVGDWNNDGTDTLGVFRAGIWMLTNRFDGGVADGVFTYGSPGDQPVVGDWNRDGTDTLGVFRGGMWYLSNFFDRGSAEGWFAFGAGGDRASVFR